MLRPKSNSETPVRVVPYQECPAKTYDSPRGTIVGRSVENHCRIVGEVAKELIRRSPVSALFPGGATFAAACHDIGKVSPTFYNKIMRACSETQISGVNPDLEQGWGGHAGVSQLTARLMGAPEYVPEILGQHHGFSPPTVGMRAGDEKFGGKGWLQEREKLVAALEDALKESWPRIESLAQARVLAGLTSVADWIGSGQHFENPHEPWEGKIAAALDDAGFVAASYKRNLAFEDVFGFSPRLAQSMLLQQVSQPGVYVLEAPMGLGKTEAALYAAYNMLQSNQASGIYFALPTQLTSNRIFERFQAFLERVLANDCQHRSLLLHANAWLFETDLGEEGRPGGAWFNQGKRGLLAPFAVGTIDQALMAAMNVKHGFVRAYGLAGKVVILDEVHTYDAYTGTLLDALVDLLRQLHCTVIILSATLNQERRQTLVGRRTASMEYPLITAAPGADDATVNEISVPAGENKHYELSFCKEDALAIDEALLRAEQGQQVLWIENTVKEAQQRYLDIASRAASLGVQCGLLHSRFTVHDRQAIEEKWVDLYGTRGWSQRALHGRILIGTQVLEQSLDIDGDFMITRFAPTDMLLQRLGRLWRHEETPRCKEAQRGAWLLVPDLEDAVNEPPRAFGASAYVYSPYVLCRSLEVWQGMRSISLPADVRSLIERTYLRRDEQGAMRRWLRELEDGNSRRKGRIALQQLARVALAEGGNTLPESKAQTRYGERDSLELLLLQSITRSSEAATLTLLTGEEVALPLKRASLTKSDWRQRTAKLMRHIVNVPYGDAPKAVTTDTLKRFGLQHCFYLGNPDWADDESVLRVALVEGTDRLRGFENYAAHDALILEYRDDLGYRVIARQE